MKSTIGMWYAPGIAAGWLEYAADRRHIAGAAATYPGRCRGHHPLGEQFALALCLMLSKQKLPVYLTFSAWRLLDPCHITVPAFCLHFASVHPAGC